MTSQIKNTKTNRISCLVFVITLTVVVINLVFLFFPALIAVLNTDLDSSINPFEPGAFALPVLITNVIVFYFWYLYNAKKIPDKIQSSVKFIQKFEISRKVAAIVIVILLGGYIVFTATELSIDERDQWDDFRFTQLGINEFAGDNIVEKVRGTFVKNFLLYSSQEVFHNIKIIPFVGSISLLLVTYFLTVEISKKRFAGIIAMIILLQSNIFLRYDTIATYSNFWTLFYIISLYMIYKRWYLSPVAYILSIFSKPFSAVFLPMTLFFTYRAEIPKEKKIRIAISYTIIFVVMIGGLLGGLSIAGSLEGFNYSDFWSGFSVWAFQLRFDTLIMLFILPLTVGLFVVSRKGIPEADSILVLIFGILLLAPLLSAFTTYDTQPYRFMPLVVFFAMGVGTLLSKKITVSA